MLKMTGGICFELKDTPAVSISRFDSVSSTPPTSFILLKVGSLPYTLNGYLPEQNVVSPTFAPRDV